MVQSTRGSDSRDKTVEDATVEEAGLVHLEKTADKWGRTGKGKSGKRNGGNITAHLVRPRNGLISGAASTRQHLSRPGTHMFGTKGHIAERCEGDGWSRWGDKSDENFDHKGHGVKQGETWWEGKNGERECWNRTWGEGHNSSGWVHKYGKSSSGEHWDTHQPQETWYERFPHYGFYHYFENSVQLREVRKPSEL